MAFNIIHHLVKRSPATLSPLRHTITPVISRRAHTTTTSLRTEGDLGNPQSTSSEQSSIKTSRATGGQKSQDNASVAQPVSDRSAIPGDKDEGTPTEDEMTRDPKELDENKRKHVERQGEKPLGSEDHQ